MKRHTVPLLFAICSLAISLPANAATLAIEYEWTGGFFGGSAVPQQDVIGGSATLWFPDAQSSRQVGRVLTEFPPYYSPRKPASILTLRVVGTERTLTLLSPIEGRGWAGQLRYGDFTVLANPRPGSNVFFASGITMTLDRRSPYDALIGLSGDGEQRAHLRLIQAEDTSPYPVTPSGPLQGIHVSGQEVRRTFVPEPTPRLLLLAGVVAAILAAFVMRRARFVPS